MRYRLITFRSLIFCGIYLAGLPGCATFKTLDTDLSLDQRLFVYSGTRLDCAAIAENDVALRKFKVTPPRYPLVDLPLSFALDSLFLPLSMLAEIFR